MKHRHSECWATVLLALIAGVHAQLSDFSLVGTQSEVLVWHLPNATQGYPSFNVKGASTLNLEYVLIVDRSDFSEELVSNQAFARLLLLPWLGKVAPTAKASLQHVTVNTSCKMLQVLQQAACNTLDVQELSRLQVNVGQVRVLNWTNGPFTAVNLDFVCDSPASGTQAVLLDGAPEPATLDCAVGHANDWQQVVDYSHQLQVQAANVHIILDSNITVPSNYSADNQGSIAVYRKLRVAPWPALVGRMVYMSLDAINGEGLWHIKNREASLTFEGLTFTTLPLGPASKYPMSLLPWGMWNVNLDRCNPVRGALVLNKCVLIVQPETMDYNSYWAGEYLSVFPDRAEAASWYGEDTTCDPFQNRTLLNQQMRLRDQLTWVAENATVLGVQLINTTLTSRFPAGLPPVPPGLQVTKLFDNPYTPYTAITWVSTAAHFVEALKAQATPNMVILQNITVGPDLWPAQPISLRQDLMITGWPARLTVLDWEGVSGVIRLGPHTLKLRNLMLMNGGQGNGQGSFAWSNNLTLYQWPIKYDRSNAKALQMQAVILVVPPSEFAILKAHSQVRQPPPGNTFSLVNGLSWLQTATFKNDSCTVPMMVDDGLLGYNVTITMASVVFPMLPRDVVMNADTPYLGTIPPGSGPPPATDDHSGRWKLVLAIALPVVVVVLAGCMFIVWRRRRRGPTSNPDWAGKSKHDPGAIDLEMAPCDGTALVREGCSGPGNGLTYQEQAKLSCINTDSDSQRELSGRPTDMARSSTRSVSSTLTTPPTGTPPQQHSGEQQLAPVSEVSPTQSVGSLLAPRLLQQMQGRPGSTGTPGLSSLSFVDSFDCAPQDQDQLLINQIDLSPDLLAAGTGPDVADQLKSLVSRMQHELGDQEVHIIRVIGHGCSGVVYQGLWRGLTVAIKSLVFTVLPAQPVSRRQQRAMTEAAICRTLQHPNIVATYSYDLEVLASSRNTAATVSPEHSHSASSMDHQSAGKGIQLAANGLELPAVDKAVEYKLYIIQEFCDGGTLKTIVDEGRLHMTTADNRQEPLMGSILQLAIDIAAGMAHVHSRNIVHGDLTPANVLLRINDKTESHFLAKVADFGLSWKLASGQEHVSNARQGTGFYISPEVLHVGIMSKAADVFSFGMLLHEMYHGTPVWRRGRAEMAEAAEAAMRRPGLEQLSWSPQCPPALRALITSCLASNPQARPTFSIVTSKLLGMQQRLRAGLGVVGSPTRMSQEDRAAEQAADITFAQVPQALAMAGGAPYEAGLQGQPLASAQQGTSVQGARAEGASLWPALLLPPAADSGPQQSLVLPSQGSGEAGSGTGQPAWHGLQQGNGAQLDGGGLPSSEGSVWSVCPAPAEQLQLPQGDGTPTTSKLLYMAASSGAHGQPAAQQQQGGVAPQALQPGGIATDLPLSQGAGAAMLTHHQGPASRTTRQVFDSGGLEDGRVADSIAQAPASGPPASSVASDSDLHLPISSSPSPQQCSPWHSQHVDHISPLAGRKQLAFDPEHHSQPLLTMKPSEMCEHGAACLSSIITPAPCSPPVAERQ